MQHLLVSLLYHIMAHLNILFHLIIIRTTKQIRWEIRNHWFIVVSPNYIWRLDITKVNVLLLLHNVMVVITSCRVMNLRRQGFWRLQLLDEQILNVFWARYGNIVHQRLRSCLWSWNRVGFLLLFTFIREIQVKWWLIGGDVSAHVPSTGTFWLYWIFLHWRDTLLLCDYTWPLSWRRRSSVWNSAWISML